MPTPDDYAIRFLNRKSCVSISKNLADPTGAVQTQLQQSGVVLLQAIVRDHSKTIDAVSRFLESQGLKLHLV
jgi:hypothetical protein